MQEKYSSKNLDHLGIVSQICDEIGIVEVIDKPRTFTKLQGTAVCRTRFSLSKRACFHDEFGIFEEPKAHHCPYSGDVFVPTRLYYCAALSAESIGTGQSLCPKSIG